MSLKQKLSAAVFGNTPLRLAKAQLEAAPALLGHRWGARREWSQHGEDPYLIDLLADHLTDGFFVDVGANHPLRRSNSYRLHCLGMRGITVEPNLELHLLQKRTRPLDTHVAAGVGGEAGLAVFYEFNYHVFSTYSREDAEKLLEDGNNIGAALLGTTPMPIFPLHDILTHCRPPDRPTFALLSVDTEGLDLQVLESNDWESDRPLCVIAEANDEDSGTEIDTFMASVGYAKETTFEVNTLYLPKG